MPKRSINLVLDWDGTITRKDTMFAMAEIVSAKDNRLGNQSSAAEQWNGFGKAYMDDYATHQNTYTPKEQDRLDRSSESAWLKRLDVVEAHSVERVERSDFFRGVKHADVLQAAGDSSKSGQVSLRPGWDRLFLRAQQPASTRSPFVNLSILSVNWSEAFIRASLRAAATHQDQNVETVAAEQIEELQILTNEIDGLDHPEGSSGRLSVDSRPRIRTSFDKLQRLQRDPEGVSVYVGDSPTDFDCLLTADIGICIRDERMGSSQRTLAETLARLKLDVLPIIEFERIGDSEQPRLIWARTLGEIDDFVSRLQAAQT